MVTPYISHEIFSLSLFQLNYTYPLSHSPLPIPFLSQSALKSINVHTFFKLFFYVLPRSCCFINALLFPCIHAFYCTPFFTNQLHPLSKCYIHSTFWLYTLNLDSIFFFICCNVKPSLDCLPLCCANKTLSFISQKPACNHCHNLSSKSPLLFLKRFVQGFLFSKVCLLSSSTHLI